MITYHGIIKITNHDMVVALFPSKTFAYWCDNNAWDTAMTTFVSNIYRNGKDADLLGFIICTSTQVFL
jgi:hypothetical protein